MYPSSTSPSDNIIPGLNENHLESLDVQTDYYSFHNIGLCLSSNESKLLAVLKPSLKHFSCTKSQLPSPHIHLSFLTCNNLAQAPFAPPPDAKEVSTAGALTYFAEETRLFTVLPGKSQVMCQLNEGWATGFIHPRLLSDSWSIKQLLFYPPFAELLKLQGLFNVHGALAATLKGRAVLITAPTGGGKSTTLVNLIRTGYSFLSDDISLVKKDASGLLLVGFPEPVNLTPSAVANFPELEFLKNTPKPCPGRKHSFCIEDVYSGCLAKEARPGWIVFPTVHAGAPTALLPMSKREALSLLIPQSVVVANKAIVRDHLQILTQLVETCSCFRLQLGQEAKKKVPLLFEDLA